MTDNIIRSIQPSVAPATSQTSVDSTGAPKPTISSSPKSKLTPKSDQTTIDVIKDFFRPVLTGISMIFGTPIVDNKPYADFVDDLNYRTQGDKDKELVYARAKIISEKAYEVIKHAQENIQQGKDPWEGLKPNLGVPMSGKLQFLRSDDLEREIFYHNVCEYQWAQSQLQIQSGQIKKIRTYEDGDNTTWNKSLDPGDTAVLQSGDKLFEDKVVIRASKDLNIEINANTARTGLVTTETSITPEGLVRRTSRAALPSVANERLGATAATQYENSELMGIIALNGTVTHKPHEETEIKPELIESAILDKILNSSIGPRINGKTIGEAFSELAVEKGFSIFEPKMLPRVLFDSEVSLGKFYHPHYLHIVKLKEECVDKKIQALEKQGKTITNEDLKAVWLSFQAEVKKVIGDSQQNIAPSKEKVWLPKNKNSELDSVYSCLEQQGLYVPAVNRIGNVDYQELLQANPQAFYEKLTEGAATAMVFHTFNNHGTPIPGAFDAIAKILDEYSHNTEFREMLSDVTCALSKAGEKYLRKDVRELRDLGFKIYQSQGAREYLNFRINTHLMNYFTRDQLKSLSTKSGVPIFNCDRELGFSPEFKALGAQNKTFSEYVAWLKNELDLCAGADLNCDSVIDSALPKNEASYYSFEGRNDEFAGLSLEKNNLPSFFYPNDYHVVNSKRKYDDKSCFSARRTIVDKKVPILNPYGQHYEEHQPPSEKHKALPSIEETMNQRLILVADGDSDGDKTMIARALEAGGFANIVLNQLGDTSLCREIISQRREYVKEFSSNEAYQYAVNELGIYGVELHGRDEQTKEPIYKRLVGFHDKNNPIYDEENLIRESQLIAELKKKYVMNIVRHSSAEANIRRKAEALGNIAGESIEFKQDDLNRAAAAYRKSKNLQPGESLSPEESKLLFLYEHSVVRREEGNLFPSDAPHSNVFTYWSLHDAHGDYIVYRSKHFGGRYVEDRQNGTEPTLFKGEISSLTESKKNIVQRDNTGDYVVNGVQECPQNVLARLKEFSTDSSVLPQPSKESGAYSLIKKFVGAKNAKWAISKLPDGFQGLLRYSGLVIGAGGILRLISPLTFGLSEKIYNAGYKTSNYVRAISALGGALRGALNVNRYWNITAGEVINICASFMNDGVKHGFLGLGNFVLFMGRGQQAAQRQQRVNNHAEEVLASDQKSNGFGAVFNKYVDPRKFASKITELGTSIVTSVRTEVEKNGLPAWLGEVGGSLLSAAYAPLRMIKDVVKDPRLIYQVVNRQSEKSGGFFKNIPSPGHVMSLVGAASGISALIAGTIGRKEKFGELKESGFNGWGRWAISAACGLPALGIIANANEVMANIDGLPKHYTGLDGKEKTYNPKAAGLLQKIAGFGFAFASMFDLSDKYAAALYDIANGLYFTGAAEEEGPNAYRTAFAEKRASGVLYEKRVQDQAVDFSNQPAQTVSREPALV